MRDITSDVCKLYVLWNLSLKTTCRSGPGQATSIVKKAVFKVDAFPQQTWIRRTRKCKFGELPEESQYVQSEQDIVLKSSHSRLEHGINVENFDRWFSFRLHLQAASAGCICRPVTVATIKVFHIYTMFKSANTSMHTSMCIAMINCLRNKL